MHGIAMHGDLKYPEGFTHFPDVNPNAPKGGTLKLGEIGTFDTLNPYAFKGAAPVGLSYASERFVFESLMWRTQDEPFSLYGWIAESVEMAEDRSWITFHLNPKARWSDNVPITADDVVFSYELLKEKGPANYRLFYKRVAKVEKLSNLSVKFTLKPLDDGTYDPELPLLVALRTILPKHYYEKRDFEKQTMEPPIGSGPYKVVSVKPGHKIVYERRNDYWAKDLPVVRGRYNFDKIEVEYYRDTHAALVAFSGGEYDIRVEGSPTAWNTKYDFKAVQDGRIKREHMLNGLPVGIDTFSFNQRRPLFQSRRVREAIALAFDFEWLNTNLFYGAFKRQSSYFQNTDLSCEGLPNDTEKAFIKKHLDELDPRMLSEPYQVPGSNMPTMRDRLKAARKLLEEDGWRLENGLLINKDGNPLKFEIMLYSHEDEKIALNLAQNLKKLGIIMTIRTIDASQYEQRCLNFDYDMIRSYWWITRSPGNEQRFYWGSQAVDLSGSYNYMGIRSKAVDELCNRIARARTRAELKAACSLLDRVLLWNNAAILLYYKNEKYIAYWDKFEHPKIRPECGITFMTWWSKKR